jgi:hypothetical protein
VNILIFVMTMLMLLSLMTYARLETYRDSQAFQNVFKHYMEKEERGYINTQADTIYQRIEYTKEKKSPKEGEQKKSPKPPANAKPRVGIKLLIDSNRDKQEKEWSQTQILLKNLIKTLYGKQPFYKKIEDERPFFIDDMIREVAQTIDDLPKDKKPKKASDLSNLRLPDPQLDDVLYKMLHGALYDTVILSTDTREPSTPQEPILESGSEGGDDPSDAEEYRSSEGYYSLLDFVTIGFPPKIRVYLASEEVLRSAFPDSTVSTILEERQRLFQRAKDDEDIGELNESFKNQFLRMKEPSVDDESLDFSVTKVNPKYYKG